MKYFTVGKIVNTHGIKGEVKVLRISDFTERFKVGNRLYIFNENDNDYIKVTIKNHRVHQGFDLLLFEEYTNINEIKTYKNCELKIDENQLTPLMENQYYYYEIIDCTVKTISGEVIGNVTNIFKTGSNDVWTVLNEKGEEFYIPFIKDIVKKISVEKKEVVIDPIEGLLE